MSVYANEYGRFQLLLDREADTAVLLLENVNRDGEHWLTLALPANPIAPSTTYGCDLRELTQPRLKLLKYVR